MANSDSESEFDFADLGKAGHLSIGNRPVSVHPNDLLQSYLDKY